MLQSEVQALSPLGLAKKCQYGSSADFSLFFPGITVVTQTITFRVQGPMSLEALLTAPGLTFIGRGVDP